MNNGKPNGGTWKTPPLDLAMQYKYPLGETGQRFYSKFPIYRPRGTGPPSVTDDINQIWQEQISFTETRKPRIVQTINRSSSKIDTGLHRDENGQLKFNKVSHGRSGSVII